MRISNARVFLDGAFVRGGIEYGSRFTAAGASIADGGMDAGGACLIPGLIDIHTHGAAGCDVSDGRHEEIQVLGRYYAKGGVTSWCPTTMTLKEDVLTEAMHSVQGYVRPDDGARIVGVNLEGPFLSRSKRGSQAAGNLHRPDASMFHRLNEASGGAVRLVTVAPEEPGAVEFIKEVSKVCTVSVGHTSADYETASAAFETGASHVTHIFNAMQPIHHRTPGVIPAALDFNASAELICDGLHVHPSVIRMTFRLFGRNTVLVSDSLRCAGMPDGEYTLGGQPITMTRGKAVLKGSDTLAGSCIHLMDAVKNAVSFGIPLETAVYAATAAPAKVIRMENEIGSIAPGLAADFVMLDERLNILKVFIGGNEIPLL